MAQETGLLTLPKATACTEQKVSKICKILSINKLKFTELNMLFSPIKFYYYKSALIRGFVCT